MRHVHGDDDQVDEHAAEGVLVHAVGLRGGGQQPDPGRAEQPPRPHHEPDHVEVDGERVEPEEGVVHHQERAEQDQHGDEQGHHPRAGAPGGMQREHPQHPRRGQDAQDERDPLRLGSGIREGQGQDDAEGQGGVGQDGQHRRPTPLQRVRPGPRHRTGHLRPPRQIYSQRKNLAAASTNAAAQPALVSSRRAVERVAVARDHHDIAPVDDVGDLAFGHGSRVATAARAAHRPIWRAGG